VAKELLRQDRAQEAVELLDMGLAKLPPSQIRFTDSNTYPFLEAYYAASAMGVEDAADKGDALLREYARTLIDYIEYYLRFDGVQGDMVSPIIDEKLDQLGTSTTLPYMPGARKSSARSTPITVRSESKRRTSWMWATSPTRSIRPLSRAKTPRNSPHQGQKTKAPPLRRGFSHITDRGFRAETVQLQQPKPPHPVPGHPTVKKHGNPPLGWVPCGTKTVSAATGTRIFSDVLTPELVSCQSPF